ncbi:MSP domain protein [Ostertagia ostertagi]
MTLLSYYQIFMNIKVSQTDAKLDVSPTELKWEFEEGQQVFKVTNNTKARFAIKVRCTDNDLYSVSPVMDFVDAGKYLTIAVVRSKGPLKKDKIVLCSKQVTIFSLESYFSYVMTSAQVSLDEKDAAEAFKTGVPNVDVIKMDQRIRA